MLKKIGFALLVGFGIPGIAVAGANTVPEPETLALLAIGVARSEERRVGKECSSRWSPYH